MPRTMWKGAISFGLVSIPVRLYPATEEKSLRFNQLHDKDHGRIKYQRVCSVCGEEVPYEHIVKGYEYEKGKYVVLEDEDFDAVPVKTSRAIDIVQFVALDEIDPIYFQKSYYLVPEETGIKPYNLLREAMSEDGRVAVAKVAIREKEHLATLRFKENVMLLETMYWPDEIRAADFDELEQDVDVRSQEVQMARSLIENLTEEFKPGEFRDEYREALLGVVEKKVAGEEIEAVPEPEATRVVDLMDALKASVDATKKKAAAEPKKRATRKSAARQPAREKKRAAS
ncbi:MAG: Ku protein [Actinomycetota bacterium]|nr:Ku protein [Actinomycetota bacterium]